MDDPTTERLLHDDEAWDRFVTTRPNPSIAQLTAWARANVHTGWGSTRVVTTTGSGCVGAQLLLHRMHPGNWQRGYVPHGPVGMLSDRESVVAFSGAIRIAAGRIGLSHVFIDPELERSHRLEWWLAGEGWRVDRSVAHRTSIVDIARDEDEILAGFDRRCRQSIAKSGRQGVRVVEAGESRLASFYAIHADTMRRAGRSIHPEAYFRSLWANLAPRGQIHLLNAVDACDTPLATVLLVGCGSRVVDLYGGTVPDGESRRANHLLKWEAMRLSRAVGYREYDLCGLPSRGVAEFKRGFGGREIEYVGYWTLVTNPTAYHALRVVRKVRGRLRPTRPLDQPGANGPELAVQRLGGTQASGGMTPLRNMKQPQKRRSPVWMTA